MPSQTRWTAAATGVTPNNSAPPRSAYPTISEGSGSDSDKEFANYLNIAHRSAFETANIVLFLNALSLVSVVDAERLLAGLEEECRMITAFRRSL